MLISLKNIDFDNVKKISRHKIKKVKNIFANLFCVFLVDK
ncbi:hypothetical protein RU87_GL000046 [Lactococcus plantarum]|jgi:hypothetical protein|uniref:Uncharacterized protein n=1 Tax=Pseudolactococcus plantarum TaxID=1365 RepID=A0A2A5S452_9LACT|nr:hypothetical protein RU87_GL000046 [Lactococcus plantarum]